MERFDRYSRKGGQWTWKRPSYERDVVSLVKAERKMEEGIASALTEVEAIEAGLRWVRWVGVGAMSRAAIGVLYGAPISRPSGSGSLHRYNTTRGLIGMSREKKKTI